MLSLARSALWWQGSCIALLDSAYAWMNIPPTRCFVQRNYAISSTRLCGWSCNDRIPHAPPQPTDMILQVSFDAADRQSWANMESQTCDLSSPREWLQYRENRCGNPGAYTVIRCDYYPSRPKSSLWKIWGKLFHMKRLCDSYRSLLESSAISSQEMTMDERFWRHVFDAASSASDTLLSRLLDKAQTALHDQSEDTVLTSDDDAYVTVMLTLLWEISKGDDDVCYVAPSIHGHAFTNQVVTKYNDYNPDYILAQLAIPVDDPPFLLESKKEKTTYQFPNRYGNIPKAKLSSWCRLRQPLEKAFKHNQSIGEVILVQYNEKENDGQGVTSNGDWFLLEGLTSNLFAVYPGGRIRTPSDGVLHGYARHLIMDHAASRCGLTVETGPILLKDSDLWEEVFFTSSIRLVIPVKQIFRKKILHVPEQGVGFEEIWSSKNTNTTEAIWREIYNGLMMDAEGHN